MEVVAKRALWGGRRRDTMRRRCVTLPCVQQAACVPIKCRRPAHYVVALVSPKPAIACESVVGVKCPRAFLAEQLWWTRRKARWGGFCSRVAAHAPKKSNHASRLFSAAFELYPQADGRVDAESCSSIGMLEFSNCEGSKRAHSCERGFWRRCTCFQALHVVLRCCVSSREAEFGRSTQEGERERQRSRVVVGVRSELPRFGVSGPAMQRSTLDKAQARYSSVSTCSADTLRRSDSADIL